MDNNDDENDDEDLEENEKNKDQVKLHEFQIPGQFTKYDETFYDGTLGEHLCPVYQPHYVP